MRVKNIMLTYIMSNLSIISSPFIDILYLTEVHSLGGVGEGALVQGCRGEVVGGGGGGVF